MRLEAKAKQIQATLPTQGSKLYKILEGLYAGYHLSVLTALRSCGTTELRKHVRTLRDYGWPIKDKWINTKVGRHKEYWMQA